MAERTEAAERWIAAATYTGLMIALLLIHLVPLSVAPGRIPGPELMLCLTLTWVLRRPYQLPTPLVAAVFLMADVLFLRPLGLQAALVVIMVEFLRARTANTREQTFMAEWLMVGVLLLVLTLAERMILAIVVVPQPSLGLAAFEMFATVAAYPLVVLAAGFALGLTKMSASEADTRGRA